MYQACWTEPVHKYISLDVMGKQENVSGDMSENRENLPSILIGASS